MTQNDWIYYRLQVGPLTALEAMRDNGCMRLAARIAELRARGHVISARPKRLASGKTIAEYWLEP